MQSFIFTLYGSAPPGEGEGVGDRCSPLKFRDYKEIPSVTYLQFQKWKPSSAKTDEANAQSRACSLVLRMLLDPPHIYPGVMLLQGQREEMLSCKHAEVLNELQKTPKGLRKVIFRACLREGKSLCVRWPLQQ